MSGAIHGPWFSGKGWIDGGDNRLLPVEKPEARTYLQERLEGRQVARMHDLITPADEHGLGFELTSGARVALWSARDFDARKYQWRVVFRWIPPMKIWTPTSTRHFGDERRNALKPEDRADKLQERVEGQWIEHVGPTFEPNPYGGETVVFHFRGGATFTLDACPPGKGSKDTSDMRFAFTDAPAKTFTGGIIIAP